MTNNNPPVHKIRDGRLAASIWAHTGENGSYHTVTFSRTYTQNEQAKSSDSFSKGQTLAIARLANKAYDWMAANKA